MISNEFFNKMQRQKHVVYAERVDDKLHVNCPYCFSVHVHNPSPQGKGKLALDHGKRTPDCYIGIFNEYEVTENINKCTTLDLRGKCEIWWRDLLKKKIPYEYVRIMAKCLSDKIPTKDHYDMLSIYGEDKLARAQALADKYPVVFIAKKVFVNKKTGKQRKFYYLCPKTIDS